MTEEEVGKRMVVPELDMTSFCPRCWQCGHDLHAGETWWSKVPIAGHSRLLGARIQDGSGTGQEVDLCDKCHAASVRGFAPGTPPTVQQICTRCGVDTGVPLCLDVPLLCMQCRMVELQGATQRAADGTVVLDVAPGNGTSGFKTDPVPADMDRGAAERVVNEIVAAHRFVQAVSPPAPAPMQHCSRCGADAGVALGDGPMLCAKCSVVFNEQKERLRERLLLTVTPEGLAVTVKPVSAERDPMPVVEDVMEHDPVSHPPHYCIGGIECIDVIEAWGLGFHLGNALKYIARAGRKEGATSVTDLEKAAFYLAREIERQKGGK